VRRDGKTRLMSFGQLGDLAAECGQVETELPETLRGPHALFGAFDLVGECADGARQALPDLGHRGPLVATPTLAEALVPLEASVAFWHYKD
jgi:hypothetical protein